MASIAKSQDLQDDLLPEAYQGPRQVFLDHCDDFNQLYPQEVPVSATTLSRLPYPQHWLSSVADEADRKALFDASSNPVKARMLSTTLPYAGGWLLTPPLRALNFVIDSRTFIALVKCRMGIPLAKVARKCPSCTSGTLDIFGNHAASCPSGLTRRHNRVRDALHTLAQQAGMHAEKEKPYLLKDDPTLRPADVYITQWHLDRPICLDVSIVNPVAPSNVVRAATHLAATAQASEQTKLIMYGTKCADNQLEFCPLVMESFGGFGPLAIPIFKKISKAMSTRREEDESDAMNTLCNRLSFVCQKSLGVTLTSCYPIFLSD
jgi:hypothetical protein